MSHVDPVYWKNRWQRESKPGIFTSHATEPSCGIHNEPKIKHDRSYSLAGKGRPCLIFISTQKCSSVIVSHFMLFGFLLGSLNENYFKDLVQTTTPSKGHLAIALDTKKKVQVCKILNRHHYGSTNHGGTHQDKNEKRKKNWNLTPDLNFGELHGPPCHTRCFAPAKLCLPC